MKVTVVAVVIFAEKLWRSGEAFGQAVGVALAAVGVLAIWFPWLLPGLHVAGHAGHAGDVRQATR